MTIANVDTATLNNLVPNLDISDVADPALRLAAFQYIYAEMQAIVNELNSVPTANLQNLSVTAAKLANLAVETGKIADLAVTTAKINDLAVTLAKMAANSVGTTQLVDLAVTQAKIANGAVGVNQLATGLAATVDVNAQFMKRGIDVTSAPFFARGDGVTDDTAAIQSAINYAATLYIAKNTVGGSTYYTGNALIKIPLGEYKITSSITVPQGIDFEMDGAILTASPADKTVDCFNMIFNAFRNVFHGGTFVGFRKAIILSTTNRNTSKLTFTGQVFHRCGIGIDTTSYAGSRSTSLVIEKFISQYTDLFVKLHCDMCHLSDGWITHSGYNGPAIYNQGFLRMDNTLCVPTPAQSGARTRWIDTYSSDDGTDALGERGLVINHCRFGGEAGSMPVVFNYMVADTNFTSYAATIIEIKNTLMFSSGTSDLANIILFAMPNRISVKNCAGFTNLTNGTIHCDSTFSSTTVPNSKYNVIDLDDSVLGASQFPILDSDLYRFLRTADNLNTMFRNTFTDGKTIKRYFALTAGSGVKVTTKLSLTTSFSSSTENKNFGASFFVAISAGIPGSYAYKAQALYLVTVTGGVSGGAKRRLNYTLIAQHPGGNTFATSTSVTSVHWGTGDTGSADIDFTTVEDNVTIAFTGTSDSSVVIIPLHGVDNYS